MSKVCIIGSTGYIGSKITHTLKRNYKIISVSRKKVEKVSLNKGILKHINGDIRSSSTIEKILNCKPDYVIFAATFNHFKSEINLNSTFNNNNKPLIKLCLGLSKIKNFKRIIYFSSFQVYGDYQNHKKIDEFTPKNPKNNYGLSHSINEDFLNIVNKKYKINFYVIRLSNAYGYPFLSSCNCWWLVINDLCKSCVTKNKIILNSDGKGFRNFIHLDDLVRFVKLLINNKKNSSEIYNLASEETVQIKDIVKTIFLSSKNKDNIKLFINKNESTNFKHLISEKPSFRISTKKINNLGFYPKTNLKIGIINLLNKLKKFKNED